MTISPHLKYLVPLVALLGALGTLAWVVNNHLDTNAFHPTDAVNNDPSRSTMEHETETPDNEAISVHMWQQMPDWHLFGEFKQALADIAPAEEISETTNTEPDLSNIPETRIPLKLSGIAFSQDQRKAFAMIVTPDGHQAEFQAGESIGTEASVHLIEERRVVIERGGKYEALSLPENSDALRNSTRTVRARAPRQTKRPLPNQKKILIDNEQNESDPEA